MDHLFNFDRKFFIDDEHSKIADVFYRVQYRGETGHYEITFHANDYITIRRTASEKYFHVSQLSKEQVEPVEDGALYQFVVHQLSELQKGNLE